MKCKSLRAGRGLRSESGVKGSMRNLWSSAFKDPKGGTLVTQASSTNQSAQAELPVRSRVEPFRERRCSLRSARGPGAGDFSRCAASAAAESWERSVDERGNHDMVSEGLLSPVREDQMQRCRIPRGVSSGPGGNLQSYSVSCELPCGPCCSLDPGTVL